MAASKKRGLGRGLDALLGMQPVQVATDGSASALEGELRHVPIALLERGRYQPRQNFDEGKLAELADSIRAQGVVQPIVVRPVVGGKRFEVIAGERRWRASVLAGLTEIPALVREVPDSVAMSVALIENIQREQLNPVEEAQALSRLIHEFEMTHQAVADAIGRSRSAVSNLLRLLDLAPEARSLLEQGQIEMGHARALLAATPELQVLVARRVVEEGLSVRAVEKLIRTAANPEPSPDPKPVPEPNADIQALENELSERLGARVAVTHQTTGRGRLVISYNSLDELEGILEHLR